MKNIVMIYCDELRCDALSCYGSPYGIKTENIDELAAHSVMFDECYCASPVCVPYRYSTLTSLPPIQTGVYHNEAAMPSFKLDHDFITFPQVLKDAGYCTASFGKTHIPAVQTPVFDVNDEMGGEMNLGINIKEEASQIMKLPGQFQSVLAADYPADKKFWPEQVTDHGIEWMLKQRQPFFIRFSYLQPHTPIVVPEKYVQRLNDIEFDDSLTYYSTSEFEKRFGEICDIKRMSAQDVQRMRKYYYAMVLWIDEQVGRIMQALKDHHLMDDTILVFTADHGANRGENGALAKQTFQPSCHRIPLLISNNNCKERRHDICSNLDLGPTLLAMNGIAVPKSFMGINLFEKTQEEVYSMVGYGKRTSKAFPNKNQGAWSMNHGWPQRVCIRTTRFRLDMNSMMDGEFVSEADEDICFIDRLKDPMEQVNRINDPEYQPIIHELVKKLRAYSRSQKLVDDAMVEMDMEKIKAYKKAGQTK